MGFHRVNASAPEGFIRGAARLMWAPLSVAFPTTISDVLNLASGVGQYDAVSTAWRDLGATRTGIQIVRNNAEETFDVDQIQGDIASAPTNWEMNVGTQLAESTLDRIAIAWETPDPTVNTTGTPDEKTLLLGQPDTYIQRRLAILYQRSDGTIRGHFFRKVQRMPQESAFTFQKTGEQLTVPVRWRCLADDSVQDPNARFGVIIDQIPGTT
jgi:hypothetical protein